MTSSGRRSGRAAGCLAVGQPQLLGPAVRPEAMQGDRALGRRAQLEPDQLRRADRRAVDGEGLAVAHIETVARAISRSKSIVPARALRASSITVAGTRASASDACERFAHDSGHGDLAREGQVGKMRAASSSLPSRRSSEVRAVSKGMSS